MPRRRRATGIPVRSSGHDGVTVAVQRAGSTLRLQYAKPVVGVESPRHLNDGHVAESVS
jgi:hypothetical protein